MPAISADGQSERTRTAPHLLAASAGSRREFESFEISISFSAADLYGFARLNALGAANRGTQTPTFPALHPNSKTREPGSLFRRSCPSRAQHMFGELRLDDFGSAHMVGVAIIALATSAPSPWPALQKRRPPPAHAPWNGSDESSASCGRVLPSMLRAGVLECAGPWSRSASL